MKKVIFVLSATVIVAVLSVAVIKHYRSYQKEQEVKAYTAQKVVDDQLQSQIKVLTSTNTKIKNQFNALVLECQKGRAAYDKLSTAQKKQSQIPNCGTTI